MTLTTAQLLALKNIFTPTQLALAAAPAYTPEQQNSLQAASEAGAPLGPNQLAAIANIPNPPIYPTSCPWTPAQLLALYPNAAAWPAGSFN